MVCIQVKSVSVDLPVFSGVDRSLRRKMIPRVVTGGQIVQEDGLPTVVHALHDINLTINDGDRVGLIGRNGAGKTTLLNTLAGIYVPTRGSVETDGRISALFDINTLMDPELTGYENIRYAGTLLGFRKGEFETLIENIADFTELGDYLAMPVRTYSSGMRVRLSFALITSTEPEILLLDEALGAGDAHFMEKAWDRAGDFYERLKIMVLATHSDVLIQELCNKAVLMDHGRILAAGPVDEVLERYQNLDQEASPGTS